MKKPKISIIVLSWNTKKLLRRCLQSLNTKLQIPNSKLEVLVVDNGSTDGSSQMVIGEFPMVRLIRNKSNLGFAKGNNIGIKTAAGDFIMLLNSDTIAPKEAIDELVDFLLKNKPVAAVSPLLISPDGKPQIDYYMKFPNLWQIFLYHNRLLRPVILKVPFLRSLICYAPQSRPFEVDQLPGAALMVRKEIWKKVGLLDEDYHFLYEDVDWSWRAKKLGYQLMVAPQAKITHFGGGSWKQKVKKNSQDFYRQYFSSMLFFVKKNYGEKKLKLFQKALVINFLIRFKFRLASYFSQINL